MDLILGVTIFGHTLKKSTLGEYRKADTAMLNTQILHNKLHIREVSDYNFKLYWVTSMFFFLFY